MTQQKNSQWKGYTFDQLIYERAVQIARIEFEKERVSINAERLREGNFAMQHGMFSKIMRTLSYADYLVIVMQLWRRVSPLFSKKK